MVDWVKDLDELVNFLRQLDLSSWIFKGPVVAAWINALNEGNILSLNVSNKRNRFQELWNPSIPHERVLIKLGEYALNPSLKVVDVDRQIYVAVED